MRKSKHFCINKPYFTKINSIPLRRIKVFPTFGA